MSYVIRKFSVNAHILVQ